MRDRVFGGVLLGGQSRRMGSAKQLLRQGDQSWLRRVLDALAPHTTDRLGLGEGPLPDDAGDLICLTDADGVLGPLAGIIAALEHRPNGPWVITACDMPSITAEAVAWLLAQRRPNARAVIPVDGRGQHHPLFGVYEGHALPLLRGIAAEGPPAPRRLVGHRDVWSPRIPDPLAAAWRNVNHPEDMDGGPRPPSS